MFCSKCGNKLEEDDVLCNKCGTKTKKESEVPKKQFLAEKDVVSETEIRSVTEQFLLENTLPVKAQNSKSFSKILLSLFLIIVIILASVVIGSRSISGKRAEKEKIILEREKAEEAIRAEEYKIKVSEEILSVINEYLSAVNSLDAEKAASFYEPSVAQKISIKSDIIALLPWSNLSKNLLSMIDSLLDDGSVRIEAVRVSTTVIDEFSVESEVKIKSSILFDMFYEEDISTISFTKLEYRWYISAENDFIDFETLSE